MGYRLPFCKKTALLARASADNKSLGNVLLSQIDRALGYLLRYLTFSFKGNQLGRARDALVSKLASNMQFPS